MARKVTISIAVPQADPADLMLDVLILARALSKTENPEPDTPYNRNAEHALVHTVILALSLEWPECTGALATGSHEFTHSVFDRAKARAQLPEVLGKALAKTTVRLCPCEASKVVESWLKLAGVPCTIAPAKRGG